MKRRNSKQRNEILKLIRSSRLHPTADELYMQMRDLFPKISIATVYRNLEQLCESGDISKLTFMNGPARYDWDPTPHSHAVCVKCHSIEDIRLNAKDKKDIMLKLDTGEFTVTGMRMIFKGLCNKCNK